MSVRLRPYGRWALLAEPDDPRLVLPLAAALRDVRGVGEVVPAARTVLVRSATGGLGDLATTITDLAGALDPAEAGIGTAEPVIIDVRYDGDDLDAVASEVGIARDEVVARHSDAAYVVAFCGFAPGFAYLAGLDPVLRCPRLADPRTRVPAGSVGIAGEHTGVYPRASPGGWRLLGRTGASLWDLTRTPPALLTPGTPVRFRPA